MEGGQNGGSEKEVDERENSPDTLYVNNVNEREDTQKRRKPNEPNPLPNLEMATPHNTSTRQQVSICENRVFKTGKIYLRKRRGVEQLEAVMSSS